MVTVPGLYQGEAFVARLPAVLKWEIPASSQPSRQHLSRVKVRRTIARINSRRAQKNQCGRKIANGQEIINIEIKSVMTVVPTIPVGSSGPVGH